MEIEDLIDSAFVELKDPAELICREDISEAAVKVAILKIQKEGIKIPIMLDGNVVVTGHERFLALREMKVGKIPTIQMNDVLEQARRQGHR